MSAKKLDNKRRWRSKTVAFRVSPEEAYRIGMMATTSGLTKQEYITKRLLCQDITVFPNSRIQKFLRQYLVELTEELKQLNKIEQPSDILENIEYLLKLITQMGNNN